MYVLGGFGELGSGGGPIMCPRGFSAFNETHCADKDECALSPDLCDDAVTCNNQPGSYQCGTCPPGYTNTTGLLKTGACVDVDECLQAATCGTAAKCENAVGSFKCSCAEGFTGDPQRICYDVDECAATARPCVAEATCSNLYGSFACTCPAGYQGTGLVASKTPYVSSEDPTTSTKLQAGSTTTTESTGTIATGTKGEPADDIDDTAAVVDGCKDIDECTTSPGLCGKGALCTNLSGSYRCSCAQGSFLDTRTAKLGCVLCPGSCKAFWLKMRFDQPLTTAATAAEQLVDLFDLRLRLAKYFSLEFAEVVLEVEAGTKELSATPGIRPETDLEALSALVAVNRCVFSIHLPIVECYVPRYSLTANTFCSERSTWAPSSAWGSFRSPSGSAR